MRALRESWAVLQVAASSRSPRVNSQEIPMQHWDFTILPTFYLQHCPQRCLGVRAWRGLWEPIEASVLLSCLLLQHGEDAEGGFAPPNQGREIFLQHWWMNRDRGSPRWVNTKWPWPHQQDLPAGTTAQCTKIASCRRVEHLASFLMRSDSGDCNLSLNFAALPVLPMIVLKWDFISQYANWCQQTSWYLNFYFFLKELKDK